MKFFDSLFYTLRFAIQPIMFGFTGAGSGTSGDPWQITDMGELNEVRNDLTAFYRLENDIDAGAETDNSGGTYWNGGAGWVPLANSGVDFTGELDFNGFSIDGLFINRDSDDVGLFDRGGSGTFLKVSLTNLNITLTTSGLIGGLAAQTNGATITVAETSGSVSGPDNTGGLLGKADGATNITQASNAATVTTSSTSSTLGAGGIAGRVADTATVENCQNSGDIHTQNVGGGIAGYMVNSAVTNKCESHGGVIDDGASASYLGGVVGRNNFGGGGSDCFWDTEVTNAPGSSAVGTGKTTSQMQDVATYTDTATTGLTNPWDFVGNPNDDVSGNDYWDINTSSYPHLTAFAAGDTTDPTPGGSGTFGATSGIEAQGFTANWTKATDDTSAASALRYYVYTSLSSNIGTVANAEANGTLQNSGGTLDIGTLAIDATVHGSFTPGDVVYYNVVVEDEAGNKAAYTESSETTWALGGNITLTGSAESSVEVGIWEITTLNFNPTDLGTPEEVVSTDASGDWTATSYDPTKTYFVAVLHNKQEDSGTASSGSTTDLTDSSKSWTVDEYAGKMVEITGGTGSGQMRKIASNTATALTPDVDFDTAPDGTSTYAIYTMYGAKTKILPVTG